MPGFLGYISRKQTNYSMNSQDGLINDELRYNNLYLHRHTANKF